jgi:hypothetical protein
MLTGHSFCVSLPSLSYDVSKVSHLYSFYTLPS